MAQLSGVKKAAILMISLGSEASSQVMKLLPDSMIQKVSYEIANTDYVTPEEKNAVIDELVDTATARQYVLDGGIDYAKDLLVNSLGPQRAKEVLDALNTIKLREQPFNIARRANEQQLVNLLVEEHPQTIALILCYMQAEKAASVLSEFPDELQSDVAERVETISATSPETIGVCSVNGSFKARSLVTLSIPFVPTAPFTSILPFSFKGKVTCGFCK